VSKVKHWVTVLSLSSIPAFLSVLCMLAGTPILISGGTLAPPALQAALPQGGLILWGAVIFLGGLAQLGGIVSEEARVERAGAILIAVGTGLLSVTLIISGVTSILALTTYTLFSGAMFARYWALGQHLKQVEDVRKNLTRGE